MQNQRVKKGNTKNSVKISKRPPTRTRLWLDLKVASGRMLATLMEIYVTMTSLDTTRQIEGKTETEIPKVMSADKFYVLQV